MSYNSKAFGYVIGQLRADRGISQEQLSGLAGISRSHLAMIERGRRVIRMDTLFKIADALEISPCVLIEKTQAIMEEENHRQTH